MCSSELGSEVYSNNWVRGIVIHGTIVLLAFAVPKVWVGTGYPRHDSFSGRDTTPTRKDNHRIAVYDKIQGPRVKECLCRSQENRTERRTEQ